MRKALWQKTKDIKAKATVEAKLKLEEELIAKAKSPQDNIGHSDLSMPTQIPTQESSDESDPDKTDVSHHKMRC